MDDAVRLPRPVMVHGHQRVEFAPQIRQLARRSHPLRDLRNRWRYRRFRGGRGLVDLALLPLPQQCAHLFGVQQSGQSEIVGFLVGPGERGGSERRAVVDHLVEFGVRTERGERLLLLAGLVLLLVRIRDQLVVEAVLLAVRLAEDVVTLRLELAREIE